MSNPRSSIYGRVPYQPLEIILGLIHGSRLTPLTRIAREIMRPIKQLTFGSPCNRNPSALSVFLTLESLLMLDRRCGIRYELPQFAQVYSDVTIGQLRDGDPIIQRQLPLRCH